MKVLLRLRQKGNEVTVSTLSQLSVLIVIIRLRVVAHKKETRRPDDFLKSLHQYFFPFVFRMDDDNFSIISRQFEFIVGFLRFFMLH